MKSSAFAIAAVQLLLAIITLGCGARTATGTEKLQPPPIDRDLLALAPSGTMAAIWIDVDQLRLSSLWNTATILVESEGLNKYYEKSPEYDPLKSVDKILGVLVQGPPDKSGTKQNTDEVLFFAKGALRIDTLLEQLLAKGGTRKSVGGFSSVQMPDFTASKITDKTIAFGSEKLIEQIPNLVENPQDSLKMTTKYATLEPNSPVAVRTIYTRNGGLPNLSTFGAPPPSDSAKEIEEIHADLSLANDLNLFVNLDMKSSDSASHMARELNNLKRKYSRHMFLVFLGVDWILQRFTFDASEKAVNVKAHMDSKDIEDLQRLAARLEKIRNLASGQSQQN